MAQTKGGTLFLDEVEAISPRAQVALLRFLQDKEYRPIGGAPVTDANVRIVAASNADLKRLVNQGSFRIDLLYQLDVLSVHLPPGATAGDAALLADVFVEHLNRQSDGPRRALHADAAHVLDARPWPRNVRELENLNSARISSRHRQRHRGFRSRRRHGAGGRAGHDGTVQGG